VGEFHGPHDKSVLHIAVAQLVLSDWLGPVESDRPIKVWAAAAGRNRRVKMKSLEAPWRHSATLNGRKGEGGPATS